MDIVIALSWINAVHNCIKAKLVGVGGAVAVAATTTKEIYREDPRRISHSLKVGVALTLVTIFCYCIPLFKTFRHAAIWDAAIWLVITVVVVFEYHVGAILAKAFNRALPTLLGASIGLGAHYLAYPCGFVGKLTISSLSAFLTASIATFIGFSPKIKARYDYARSIFILTFALIIVSGFQQDKIIELALMRLFSVLTGIIVSVVISITIKPVWAGDELHNLTPSNLGKLANSLDGTMIVLKQKYFKTSEDEESPLDKSLLQGHKDVLDSKTNEQSWANFATWEPPHGQFSFCHPWESYLKIGTLARECASVIGELQAIILNDDIQAPQEIKSEICSVYTNMGMETSKALRELELAMKTKTQPTSDNSHFQKAQNLSSQLQSSLWINSLLLERPDFDFQKVTRAIAVGKKLIDIVNCTCKMYECVQDLAAQAKFEIVASIPEIAIPIDGLNPAALEQDNSSTPITSKQMVNLALSKYWSVLKLLGEKIIIVKSRVRGDLKGGELPSIV